MALERIHQHIEWMELHNFQDRFPADLHATLVESIINNSRMYGPDYLEIRDQFTIPECGQLINSNTLVVGTKYPWSNVIYTFANDPAAILTLHMNGTILLWNNEKTCEFRQSKENDGLLFVDKYDFKTYEMIHSTLDSLNGIQTSRTYRHDKGKYDIVRRIARDTWLNLFREI